MKQTNHARLMLILSMAVFGTLAPFVRHIPLTSGELALGRAVLAAGLIALYLLITGQKIPLHGLKKELLLLLLSGAAMGINWILLFEAYKYTTVSIRLRIPSCKYWPRECKSAVSSTLAGKMPPPPFPSLSPNSCFHHWAI